MTNALDLREGVGQAYVRHGDGLSYLSPYGMWLPGYAAEAIVGLEEEQQGPVRFASKTFEYLQPTVEELNTVADLERMIRAQSGYQQIMSPMLACNDSYTFDHSHRVAISYVIVALRLGITDEARLYNMYHAAFGHDIGKTLHCMQPLVQSRKYYPLRGQHDGVYDMDIRPLDERAVLRRHIDFGPIFFGRVFEGSDAIKRYGAVCSNSHHSLSRSDSYGPEPPVDLYDDVAILAAVDKFDALASCRPYRNYYFSWQKCEEIIKEDFKGDPRIIEAIFSAMHKKHNQSSVGKLVVSCSQH